MDFSNIQFLVQSVNTGIKNNKHKHHFHNIIDYFLFTLKRRKKIPNTVTATDGANKNSLVLIKNEKKTNKNNYLIKRFQYSNSLSDYINYYIN